MRMQVLMTKISSYTTRATVIGGGSRKGYNDVDLEVVAISEQRGSDGVNRAAACSSGGGLDVADSNGFLRSRALGLFQLRFAVLR